MLKRFSLALIIMTLSVFTGMVAAQRDTTWVPIGGFYTTLPEFMTQVLEAATGDRIYVLVVPAPFSLDATTLTADDLLQNTLDAEVRRQQIEDTCQQMAPDRVCDVALIPLYTREAALSKNALGYLPNDIAGVYFLGGDQTIAMQIIANTPLEDQLESIFNRGIPMGGNSAGLAIASRAMIGGYTGEFGPETGLAEGSVDIWNTDDRRGLDFGVESVVLEQHFWERSRLPRLLNALVQPDMPPVGIGVDSLTGGLMQNDQVFSDVFGRYGVAVVDVATYGADATANYENPNGTLSIRNVLFHSLMPGTSSYDTVTRQHNLAVPNPPERRAYEGLTIPEGAGTLILGGNMFGPLVEAEDHTLLRYFNEVAGGSESSMLIVAIGYRDDAAVTEAVGPYQDALVLTPSILNANGQPYAVNADIGGVLVIANNQSRINPELLAPVVEAWRAGTPVMLDNAAAAVAGAFYSAEPPTPFESNNPERIEEATQASFLQGHTQVEPGLGMVNVMVEPQVMDNNRWGRVVSLAYTHPELLSIGISADTAVEFTQEGVKVLGLNGVFVFDFRTAALDLGTNEGYVVANGILDVFGAEEALVPTPITAAEAVGS